MLTGTIGGTRFGEGSSPRTPTVRAVPETEEPFELFDDDEP